MNARRATTRILATALSLVLVYGAMNPTVMARRSGNYDSGGEITTFAPLPEQAAYQSVSLGTSFSELDLPADLEAEVDGADGNVPVTWESRPDYDGAVADAYTLTATVGGNYSLAVGVRPPEILVRVGEPTGVMPTAYTDYQFHDINAMNQLITNTGIPLSQFTSSRSDPPADWDNIVIWDKTSFPYRIVQLELSGMGITGELDIHQGDFGALEVLNCDDNDLTGLTIIGSPSLRSLNCNNNRLFMLILGNTETLKELHCANNQLDELPIARQVRNLEILYCGGNQLTSLDVSGMPALKGLSCSGSSSLTSLNVQGCTRLESIDCSSSRLDSLDVSGLSNLRELYCQNNQLTDLVLGTSTTLQMLYCQNNRLYRLDMSGLDPATNFEDFNYNGAGQNPTLVLEGEEACGFFSIVHLQSPAFGNRGVSYTDRVLKSIDKTVTDTAFFVHPEYQFGGGTARATLSGNMKFTYTAPVTQYNVAVRSSGNGTARTNVTTALIGARIALNAQPGSGYQFKEWTVDNSGVVFEDSKNPNTAFVMTAGDVQVTAHFEPATTTNTYLVTVNNGSGGGAYAQGATVQITADAAPTGQRFQKWVVISGGVSLVDAQAVSTAFTMPGEDVAIKAVFEKNPDIGGSTHLSERSSDKRSAVAVKAQLPPSAFSWDGDRTLTINYENITALGLLKVEWDGTATTSYGVYEGSVVVRFDQDFINGQKEGEHTVRVEFLNYYGETTFTVGGDSAATGSGDSNNPDDPTSDGNSLQNPQTGGSDFGGGFWLVALSLASALVAGGRGQLRRYLRARR